MTHLETARRILGVLVREPLTDMWRAGFQIFEFGVPKPFVNRHGETVPRADHALHLSGRWWVDGPDGFRLGSEHFGEPRTDEHAAAFYNFADTSPLVVAAVTLAEDGALRIDLTGGYAIHSPPPLDPDDESWRYFLLDDGPDVVMYGEGLSIRSEGS